MTPWRQVSGLAWWNKRLYFSEQDDQTVRGLTLDGHGSLQSAAPVLGLKGRTDTLKTGPFAHLHGPGALAYHQNLKGWLVAEQMRHWVKFYPEADAAKGVRFAGVRERHEELKGSLTRPMALAIHQGTGLVWVLDQGKHSVKLFDQHGLLVTRFPAVTGATGIVVDQATGRVYLSQGYRHQIQMTEPVGAISSHCAWTAPVTFAGVSGQAGYLDATRATSLFREPRGLALASIAGEPWLLVADSYNHVVRQVSLPMTGC